MKKLSIIILIVFFYGTTDGSTLITNDVKTERICNDNKDKKVKSNCCKSSDKKKECSKENKNTCEKTSNKKECSKTQEKNSKTNNSVKKENSKTKEKKSQTNNSVKKECCSKNKKSKCSKE